MTINIALKINSFNSSGFILEKNGISPTIPAHIAKDNDIMIIEYEKENWRREACKDDA